MDAPRGSFEETWLLGEKRRGSYEIEDELGQGAYGIVYLVHDKEHDRKCVMKEVPLVSDEEKRAKAFLEVETLQRAAKSSTGVVQYYEHFVTAKKNRSGSVYNETLCIIMEVCHGGELGEFLKTMKRKQAVVPEEVVWRWFLQLVVALSHLHSLDILHRDIKPANIFLTESSMDVANTRLGDFGTSKIVNDLTEARTMTGTLLYMAPEVLHGGSQTAYTFKADSWSLGCVLFEMCTRTRAFNGASQLLICQAVCHNTIPILPGTPGAGGYSEDLRGILARLLQRNPSERASMRDILDTPLVRHRLGQADRNSVLSSSFRSLKLPVGEENAGTEADHKNTISTETWPLPTPTPPGPQAAIAEFWDNFPLAPSPEHDKSVQQWIRSLYSSLDNLDTAKSSLKLVCEKLSSLRNGIKKHGGVERFAIEWARRMVGEEEKGNTGPANCINEMRRFYLKYWYNVFESVDSGVMLPSELQTLRNVDFLPLVAALDRAQCLERLSSYGQEGVGMHWISKYFLARNPAVNAFLCEVGYPGVDRPTMNRRLLWFAWHFCGDRGPGTMPKLAKSQHQELVRMLRPTFKEGLVGCPEETVTDDLTADEIAAGYRWFPSGVVDCCPRRAGGKTCRLCDSQPVGDTGPSSKAGVATVPAVLGVDSSPSLPHPSMVADSGTEIKGGTEGGTEKKGTDPSVYKKSNSEQKFVDRLRQGGPDLWEIPYNEIKQDKILGRGMSATVFSGTWKGNQVAVKQFNYVSLKPKIRETFRKELVLLRQLLHPNIVLFMGACVESDPICIITEYLPNGNLFDKLFKSDEVLSDRTILGMATDTARGMNFLHTHTPPVIHRDLKPHNLVLDEHNRVKVADLGGSRYLRHGDKEGDKELDLTMECGTRGYQAPELVTEAIGGSYTEKVDQYSFGFILYELVTRTKNSDYMQKLNPGQHPEFPQSLDGIRALLAQLAIECWQADPTQRPSFLDILERLQGAAQNYST